MKFQVGQWVKAERKTVYPETWTVFSKNHSNHTAQITSINWGTGHIKLGKESIGSWFNPEDLTPLFICDHAGECDNHNCSHIKLHEENGWYKNACDHQGFTKCVSGSKCIPAIGDLPGKESKMEKEYKVIEDISLQKVYDALPKECDEAMAEFGQVQWYFRYLLPTAIFDPDQLLDCLKSRPKALQFAIERGWVREVKKVEFDDPQQQKWFEECPLDDWKPKTRKALARWILDMPMKRV